MRNYDFRRKSTQGVQTGSSSTLSNFLVIALAILAALAKLCLLSGCAPDALPADRAMRKHYPNFQSSDPTGYYDSLYRNLPEAQVTPRDPNPPEWCIDQFTGKRIECPVISFHDDTIIITNKN